MPIAEDAHFLECARYIERNPLDAKIVKDLRLYPYTSYSYYAFGKANDLIKESSLYATLGTTEAERQAIYQFYVTHERKQEIEALAPF